MKYLKLFLSTLLVACTMYSLSTTLASLGRGFEVNQKLLADDGDTGDTMGYSVAISGDTALVGVPYDDIDANEDQGSAYVFVRNGTTWSQQAKLTADDSGSLDVFGISVALSGDTALVGAYNHDVGTNEGQGAAYVFVRSDTTWTLQQQLTIDDGETFDSLGYAVALEGDTAVLGAVGDTVGINSGQGSAYVFIRTGTTWTQQAQLIADDGAAIDNFGSAIALSGDTVVVAALNATIEDNERQGATYVFVRSGTTWSQQAKLISSDGAGFDFFGYSVSLAGHTAVIGAPSADVEGNQDQGAAYVFVRDGTTWTEHQKLTASDGTQTDSFGYSSAISEGTILVGANGDDIDATENQGSAYVFEWDGVVGVLQEKIIAGDGAQGDFFGNAIALDGDIALIAAFGVENGEIVDAGAAYVVVYQEPVPTATPDAPTETPTDEPTATETPTVTPTTEPDTTELIVNGGFEDANMIPWVIKNASGDKVKCNKDKDGDGIPDKIVAYTGNCAFQLKNVIEEAGKIQQTLDLSAVVPTVGDTLNLSFFAQSKGGATVKFTAVFKYPDDTKTKLSIESSGLETYTAFTGSGTLTNTIIVKSKISGRSTQTSGKVLIDDVTLLYTPSNLIGSPVSRITSNG